MRRHHLITAAFWLVTFLGAWAFWWEPSRLVVNESQVAVSDWPAACSGLRIAVLTDLHVGSLYKGLDSIPYLVATTAAASPDLVLLAGDYIAGGVAARPASPESIADSLRGLAAPLGVYAVMGNHDIWEGEDVVAAAFRSRGLRVLEDESVLIEKGECRFWLAGLSDFDWGPKVRPDPYAKIPPEGTIVAFTHNPDVFPTLPRRVNLTVAGHTHGGQVRLPFLGRPIVPSRYGERYAIGLVEENGRQLFVSTGIGTSKAPLRFGVPPEISVLTLRRRGSR